MTVVVYIEREEDLEGNPKPGSGDWVRYAGPFTPGEAKAYITALGPNYRVVGENHKEKYNIV